MLSSIDFSGRPFHFIGVGGIGMSALAYILAKRKLPVSGSDIRLSHITHRLQSSGVHIFDKQDSSNLELFCSQAEPALCALPSAHRLSAGAVPETLAQSTSAIGPFLANKTRAKLPQVICSSAIDSNNLEYEAALDIGCPIFHRSELLAALIQNYYSIAVAGTHGKTTTSSLIGYLLLQASLDPTIIVGGEVNAWQGNARLGQGEYLVAEADESDGSLINLSAQIGVVTNIELDHPDHYQTLEQVVSTFQVFGQHCQTLVGCIDCTVVKEQLRPNVSYSLSDTSADYTVTNVTYHPDGTTACVWERSTLLGVLNLRLLGQHNLSNALAAVAVGRLLGLEFPVIAKSIASFEGARRRFEWRGEVKGITFIDDYAHHPSEIRATLAAARLQAKPPARVVAIFQPHRYSRTLAFLPDFAQSFAQADRVVVSEIYSAGEPNLGQVSGRELVEAIATHQTQVTYQPTLNAICQFLLQTLRSGDLALFLGAGNLNQIIPEVMTALRQA